MSVQAGHVRLKHRDQDMVREILAAVGMPRYHQIVIRLGRLIDRYGLVGEKDMDGSYVAQHSPAEIIRSTL